MTRCLCKRVVCTTVPLYIVFFVSQAFCWKIPGHCNEGKKNIALKRWRFIPTTVWYTITKYVNLKQGWVYINVFHVLSITVILCTFEAHLFDISFTADYSQLRLGLWILPNCMILTKSITVVTISHIIRCVVSQSNVTHCGPERYTSIIWRFLALGSPKNQN